MQSGSPENIKYEQVMTPFGDTFSKTSKGLEAEGKKYLDEINRVLSQKEFQKINEAIDKYIKDKKLNYEPPWYAPLGIPNVRQLAIKLDRLHEYEIFYSTSSNVMHSSKHKSHVTFKGSTIHFQPIRNLEGIKYLLDFSISTIMRVFMDVLRHYRYEELDSFRKKYIEDWRKAFRSTKKVKYVPVKG
jgi:hypothetical protein